MKIFKAILLIVSPVIVSGVFAPQTDKQNAHSGIYLTLSDFLKNKLTHEVDCSKNKEKIKSNTLFGDKPYIDVVYEGKKFTYQKKDIYGYRDCNNITYRFFNNKEYVIAETLQIYVYYIEHSVLTGVKGNTALQKDYFFSIKPDGDIKELTLFNLKSAFPDNTQFHDLLDAQFSTDKNLALYDDFHKMYKINHLLISSKMKYCCPMHPNEKSDEPGKCPKCGMEMKPIEKNK